MKRYVIYYCQHDDEWDRFAVAEAVERDLPKIAECAIGGGTDLTTGQQDSWWEIDRDDVRPFVLYLKDLVGEFTPTRRFVVKAVENSSS